MGGGGSRGAGALQPRNTSPTSQVVDLLTDWPHQPLLLQATPPPPGNVNAARRAILGWSDVG